MRMRKNQSCSSLLPSYGVNVSYQKNKNCRQQSGQGLRFEICRIVGGFLQEPQSCPVFCLIDWWTENELCWEVAPLWILASKYSRKKKISTMKLKSKEALTLKFRCLCTLPLLQWGVEEGRRLPNWMFAIVLVVSPVLVEARIPSEKHFLFRIIIFGFIGTGSAENIKHHLKERGLQWLKFQLKREPEEYFPQRKETGFSNWRLQKYPPQKTTLYNKNVKVSLGIV